MAGPPDALDGGAPPWRLIQRAGLVLGVVAFAVFLISLPGGPVHLAEQMRNLWLYNLVELAAAVAVGAGAVREPRLRLVWSVIAIALIANVAANVYYSLALASMEEAPYPSWADAGFLAFYPLMYLGLVGLLRARVTCWHPSMWLDGLMVALCVGALGAAFVLAPVLQLTGAALAVVVTNLAYPLGDLLLMSTVVAGVSLLARRMDAQWALLGAGVLANGVGDTVFLVQDSAGQYTEGTALDLTWLAGAILIAAAASWETGGRRSASAGGETRSPGWSATPKTPVPTTRSSRWTLLGVPAAVTAISLGLLVPVGQWQGATAAQWMAAAALCVVGARTSLTYREVWQLSDIRRQAVTDELTGLTNRRGFTSRAEAHLALPPAARTGIGHTPAASDSPDASSREHSALLLLDLDQFKEVNDSLGHHAGDVLLAAIAERLADTCRGPRDMLARLGGDEFAILLPGTDSDGAERVSERIRAVLAEPFIVDGVLVQAAVSIGIAVAPEHGSTLSLLMRRSDIAMYRAKATRSGHAVYDPTRSDPDGEDRLHRVADLRGALDDHQLVLHYQPKIDLAGGAVTGVEALVRWEHPTRGLLYPDAFLDLAEEVGLMPALTAEVLEQALAQAAAWHGEGRHLTVAVNLPTAAVVDTALPGRIIDLLARYRLPAAALKLEITEDSLLDDRVRAREVLARLRHAGVQIAIDDYGSGYSSLAYLRELPVDELKLDRSFVFPMADDARAAAIVRSTVELAHSLGLRIVAEGVEHPAAAADLARYGCDTAQGFLYSRALPPVELTQWLDERHLPSTAPPALPRPRAGAEQPSHPEPPAR